MLDTPTLAPTRKIKLLLRRAVTKECFPRKRNVHSAMPYPRLFCEGANFKEEEAKSTDEIGTAQGL